ncbi:MAG: 30S ribosomal protein S2 [Patescibacteria group bacterium]|nr:30S ribosomal protein S2 [Patescibacteria group bacterium]
MDQTLLEDASDTSFEEGQIHELNAAEEARVKALMEIGAFYGLSKSRTNPKMRANILTTKSGVEVIDLEKTIGALDKAAEAIKSKVKSGGTVLFVGTTPSAKETVRTLGERLRMPYVSERWLGGTLTNFKVISQRIAQLKKIKEDQESGNLGKYTKKERLQILKELEKMDKFFHGLFDMERMPAVMVIVDLRQNILAAREARKAGVVSVATVNTDVDPELADYPIPVNDKTVKTIGYVMDVIGQAIEEGRKEYEAATVKQAENKQNG